MFANVVYILCALTAAGCGVLLWRGHRQSGARLLFWSAICFFGLAANNVLLLVDLRVLPSIDLSTWRLVPAVLGASALVYALVWEAE